MSTATWWLTVKGHVSTTILLHDGDEQPLARLDLSTRSGLTIMSEVTTCRAVDRWDRTWTVTEHGGTLQVTHDGATWVKAEGDVVRVEDRRLHWEVRHDGSRRATVTDADDRRLLEIGTKGCGSGEWAQIHVHDDLPRPLPVVLAAVVPLLVVDASLVKGTGAGSGAGPGN